MPTNADYAKINIACKELGLDKHQLISDRYGLESSKDLKPRQLADLYAHFRSLGWRVKRNRRKGPASPKYDDGMARKVVALWIHLSETGVVKSRGNLALQAYVKRMTGVDDLKWCTARQLYTLIESLKKWAKRENIDVEAD